MNDPKHADAVHNHQLVDGLVWNSVQNQFVQRPSSSAQHQNGLRQKERDGHVGSSAIIERVMCSRIESGKHEEGEMHINLLSGVLVHTAQIAQLYIDLQLVKTAKKKEEQMSQWRSILTWRHVVNEPERPLQPQ